MEQRQKLSFENLESEEIIDGGLGLLIKRKRLYHGSGTNNITNFNVAEEATVGNGVYFTSEINKARGYAERRTKFASGGDAVVYTVDIENMNFVDLRTKENVQTVLNGFVRILQEEVRRDDLKRSYRTIIINAIDAILKNEVSSLRQITFGTGKLFTDYVKSLGYDGLITIEGGEGEEVEEHDTYLVFDPEKIKNPVIES